MFGCAEDMHISIVVNHQLNQLKSLFLVETTNIFGFGFDFSNKQMPKQLGNEKKICLLSETDASHYFCFFFLFSFDVASKRVYASASRLGLGGKRVRAGMNENSKNMKFVH